MYICIKQSGVGFAKESRKRSVKRSTAAKVEGKRLNDGDGGKHCQLAFIRSLLWFVLVILRDAHELPSEKASSIISPP